MNKKILLGLVFLFSFMVLLEGCRKEAPSKETKIGAILPLTGDIASYGIRVKEGAEIAAKELITKGLPPLSIEFQDDQNIAKNAISIMSSFCTIKHYPVVIGAAGSSVSMAIAPLANQYKIVQISPLSSSEELSVKGGDYFFRVCPADDQQAKILAKWVLERTYSNIAVIYTNNSWGQGLAESFKKNYGKEIIIYEGTREGETDFRTLLIKIKGEGCKAIISPTYPKEGGILVKQARELGIDCDLFGADNWGAPEFIKVAGEAANNCFFISQYSYNGPEFQHLNEEYKKITGKEADVFVAYGYDTVYAISKALKTSKTKEGADIRNALLNIAFQGASGYIAFAPNGDLKIEAFEKKIILNGKPQVYEKGKD
jgi:branched-chain amino acid transport system substrate-binding protein